MKYLNKFINEKLILNKSTKLYYDVDNIKGYNKEVLYSSRWEFKDDNDEAIQWNDCKHELSTIDKESNTGFIITPPPSPHIAPTTEARNPTRSNTISISYSFLSIA